MTSNETMVASKAMMTAHTMPSAIYGGLVVKTSEERYNDAYCAMRDARVRATKAAGIKAQNRANDDVEIYDDVYGDEGVEDTTENLYGPLDDNLA